MNKFQKAKAEDIRRAFLYWKQFPNAKLQDVAAAHNISYTALTRYITKQFTKTIAA